MQFDPEGHVAWTPPEFVELARRDPTGLINFGLLHATPVIFPDYATHCLFLSDVARRIDVHPKSILVRGSCLTGFSTAPDQRKWGRRLRDNSDLDLAIVDARYFERIENELVHWEHRNPRPNIPEKDRELYVKRLDYRRFNCCAEYTFPSTAVCVRHRKMMGELATGVRRRVSAFIFHDWYSLQNRYEFELNKLCRMVDEGILNRDGDAPTSAVEQRSGD